ncbi:4F2 cell-surface antigen heavy chain [Spea bombifrons]|uniref:4F2 cell-surface antigen heavy chain n=1 Tax=Spea bombifrons TaxID=233779 RepID=UPI00234A73A0|nr:4F2 cell-surface antigen heavy chain [Spea bombifrons]
MTQDTALDMKDVELNELDQEKVPMAAGAGDLISAGGEKNGVVKVKLEADGDLGTDNSQKFTGLSKEELLKVAGTPGWVRVRWILLILFWVGWIGMLAGAVVIIVQAPRCRPLPEMQWWNKGPLYLIGNPETFQDSNEDAVGDIKGIEQRLDSLSSLKVKGLVVGPLHVTKEDSLADTHLTEIDPKYGTEEHFRQLLEAAHKKSIEIILDLTPNYQGDNVWFSQAGSATDGDLQKKVKEAMDFWLEQGAAGIYLSGIEKLENPTDLLAEFKNITANHSKQGKARVLLASTDEPNYNSVLNLFNETAVGLLSSRYFVEANTSQGSLGDRINQYMMNADDQWNSWAIGGPRVGHMASLIQEKLLHVYQLLLFTLKGTPVTQYGDEIGLKDLPGQPAHSQGPYMQWDDSTNYGFSSHPLARLSIINMNVTFKAQEEDSSSLLSWYKRLSELRGKERALLHGDFYFLHISENSLAFLRSWDQNERFVSALNFDPDSEVELMLTVSDVPEQCSVVLSSNPQRQEGSNVSVRKLKLAPGEALLLKYPYNG